MVLPTNDVECEVCKEKFKPNLDVDKLPLYNQAKKYNWALVICPKCGVRHRGARFSKKGYVIHVIKE